MGARRVYWIQLLLLLAHIAKFIGKYNKQLQDNLTPEQFTCVNSTLTAINDCIKMLPRQEIGE